MSVNVPLGVRIYNNFGKAFDVWVTRWVDDITFRSVIPGGFASATIKLHNEPSQPFEQIAKLFNRVQIVDLRSQEIAWEGRVDTALRNTGDDTWDLGCLGAMVAATDIQRPVWYIDSDVDSWIPYAASAGFSDFRKNKIPEQKKLETVFADTVVYTAGALITAWTWQRGEETDLYIGRFDATYAGTGSHPNLSRLATAANVMNGGGAGLQTNVDVTTLTTAPVRKANAVGAGSSFTSTVAQRIEFTVGNSSATSTTVAEGQATSWVADPRVQVQRVDEAGTKLQTAASYPNDYLSIEQIVKDVVGRFLVAAWRTGGNNIPYTGQVRAEDIYIDSTSTARITHLVYWDGTTAADIFADLMTAQPNAYWALWESKYGATDGAAGQSETGFRFEWATWPNSWGYQATSIDGLEEQPDGGNVFNYVFYQYPTDSPWDNEAGYKYLQNLQASSNENQLLADARLVRAMTVKAEEPQSSTTAFDRAQAIHGEQKRTVNTGTLTVKRPIHFYDAGVNSYTGASRMLDPWMLRPGKLIRITDIPPRANGNTFNHGASPYAPELDGSVFRVVSTEYRSADNSCVLELDTVPAWEMATQVAKTKPSGQLVARG